MNEKEEVEKKPHIRAIAVVGSRTFCDYNRLCEILNELRQSESAIQKIWSGGADGADKLGARYARENHIEIEELLPKWNLYGRGAGLMRNTDIVIKSDMVVAFWDGVSHGTKDSINKARAQGKRLLVYNFKTNAIYK
jgi:hypothetical protein